MNDILSIVAYYVRIGSVTISGNDLKLSGKRKDEQRKTVQEKAEHCIYGV